MTPETTCVFWPPPTYALPPPGQTNAINVETNAEIADDLAPFTDAAETYLDE